MGMPGSVAVMTETVAATLSGLLTSASSRRFVPTAVWHLRVWPTWRLASPVVADDFRLLFIRGGRGTYWIEGVEVPLVRGRIVLIGGGTRFRFDHDRRQPPIIVPCRFGIQGFAAPGPLATALMADDVAAAESLFLELAACWGSGDLAGCSSAIHLILGRIRRQLAGAPGQHGDPRVERVRDAIDREPLARTSPERFARLAGLSPDRLSRLFRARYGLPPTAYRLQRQMLWARQLLLQPGTSVADVAAELGYADAFVFSRQYRRVMGRPPSADRPGRPS